MGKAEGNGENWHGHVTALTVAPEFRRLGLAAKLMHILEDISDKYVWTSNHNREHVCVEKKANSFDLCSNDTFF